VQLVGVYLVFATLIVPPLATRAMAPGRRMIAAWTLGAVGYAVGLGVSAALDLPSGPTIVWALAVLALIWYALAPRVFAVPA
jgi:zinc/manganese transport system permease protein